MSPSHAPLTSKSNRGVMPTSDKAKLLKIGGIRSVTPVLTYLETQQGITVIYGVDLQSYTQQVGEFTYLGGRPFRSSTAHEVLVDDIYAKEKGLRVGDSHILKGNSFQVCGVIRHGAGARIFAPIETLQGLIGGKGNASWMLIKCQSPSQIQAVMMPSYHATTMRELLNHLRA